MVDRVVLVLYKPEHSTVVLWGMSEPDSSSHFRLTRGIALVAGVFQKIRLSEVTSAVPDGAERPKMT